MMKKREKMNSLIPKRYVARPIYKVVGSTITDEIIAYCTDKVYLVRETKLYLKDGDVNFYGIVYGWEQNPFYHPQCRTDCLVDYRKHQGRYFQEQNTNIVFEKSYDCANYVAKLNDELLSKKLAAAVRDIEDSDDLVAEISKIREEHVQNIKYAEDIAQQYKIDNQQHERGE